jgi:hypothetical protein
MSTATSPADTTPLKRKAKVVAAVDLPEIPAGTPGKVTMVSGLTWIRYWVRFANGITRGSIDRSELTTPEQWAKRA